MARLSPGVIEHIWPLPLENKIFITKEVLKSGKIRIQIGHVNAFEPGQPE